MDTKTKIRLNFKTGFIILLILMTVSTFIINYKVKNRSRSNNFRIHKTPQFRSQLNTKNTFKKPGLQYFAGDYFDLFVRAFRF